MRLERGDRGVHRARVVGPKMRAAHELHQIGVASLARRKERDRPVACAALPRCRLLHRLRLAPREIDIQRHADNGLDAGVRELVGELQRAEQIAGVGEAERRQLVRRGELGQRRDRQRALEQGIGRVDLEVHEFRGPGALSIRGGG